MLRHFGTGVMIIGGVVLMCILLFESVDYDVRLIVAVVGAVCIIMACIIEFAEGMWR